MKNKFEYFEDYMVLIISRRNGDIFKIYIDIEEKENIGKLSWHVGWKGDIKSFYAENSTYMGVVNGKPKYKITTMQNYIMKPKIGYVADHINPLNTLDNRKENLRIIKRGENLKNRSSRNSNNTSGYRNVTWIRGFWRVQLQIDGKNKLFSDKFTDVHLAGGFAEKMRQKYYGVLAGLS